MDHGPWTMDHGPTFGPFGTLGTLGTLDTLGTLGTLAGIIIKL